MAQQIIPLPLPADFESGAGTDVRIRWQDLNVVIDAALRANPGQQTVLRRFQLASLDPDAADSQRVLLRTAFSLAGDEGTPGPDLTDQFEQNWLITVGGFVFDHADFLPLTDEPYLWRAGPSLDIAAYRAAIIALVESGAASVDLILDDGEVPPGVDAGTVTWRFDTSRPTVTKARGHRVDAGVVPWRFTTSQPAITKTGRHEVDAGTVPWRFTTSRPTVRKTTNHRVNAGTVAWNFNTSRPTTGIVRNHRVNAGTVAWNFNTSQPRTTIVEVGSWIPWGHSGTTPRTVIGDLDPDTEYEVEIRATREGAAPSAWINAPNGRTSQDDTVVADETIGPFYIRSAGRPDVPDAQQGTDPPVPWQAAAPTATTTLNVWQIVGRRPGGTQQDYVFATLTLYLIRTSVVADELIGPFYIRSAGRPDVPDAQQGIGPPAGWQAAAPTATTTLNVWQIVGSRPGGTQNFYRFTTLTLYLIRTSVVADETIGPFYIRSAGRPDVPDAQQGIGPPAGWQEVPPTATTTLNVWQIVGRRPGGTQNFYRFTTLTLYLIRTSVVADETIGPFYIRSAGRPDVPDAQQGTDPPVPWQAAAPTATTTLNVWQIVGRRPGGTQQDYVFTTLTLYLIRTSVIADELIGPFYIRSAGRPDVPDAQQGIGPPAGWQEVPPTATTTLNVWQIVGRRPGGTQQDYVFATLTLYLIRTSVVADELIGPFYIRSAGRPDVPDAQQGIGPPAGWQEVPPTATTTLNVWQIVGSRPGGTQNFYRFTTLTLYLIRTSVVADETIGPFYIRSAGRPDVPDAQQGTDPPVPWQAAAPTATTTLNVWQIVGRRPGGTQQDYVFTTLTLYLIRTSVIADELIGPFYIRSAGRPDVPDAQQGIGPPAGWQEVPPTATTTLNVWQIVGRRPGGTQQDYVFATLTLYLIRTSVVADELIGPFYIRSAGRPDVPDAQPGTGPPPLWQAAAPTATTTLNVWQIVGSRPGGTQQDYVFTTLTLYLIRTSVAAAETIGPFYIRSAGPPDVPDAQQGIGPPADWQEVPPTATTTLNVWQIVGSRPGGTQQDYVFTTLTLYLPRTLPTTPILPVLGPQALIATFTVNVAGSYTIPEAVISDGSTLVYALTPDVPAGLMFQDGARTIAGTPTLRDITPHVLRISVQGDATRFIERSLVIYVLGPATSFAGQESPDL